MAVSRTACLLQKPALLDCSLLNPPPAVGNTRIMDAGQHQSHTAHNGDWEYRPTAAGASRPRRAGRQGNGGDDMEGTSSNNTRTATTAAAAAVETVVAWKVVRQLLSTFNLQAAPSPPPQPSDVFSPTATALGLSIYADTVDQIGTAGRGARAASRINNVTAGHRLPDCHFAVVEAVSSNRNNTVLPRKLSAI